MNNVGSNDQQTLGILLAKVTGLEASVERAERKSDESRAVMHRRLDDVVDRVAGLESNVRAVTDDVHDMKPVTDDVKRWKLMGIGALGVVGIGGLALGVSFADVLRRIMAIIVGKI